MQVVEINDFISVNTLHITRGKLCPTYWASIILNIFCWAFITILIITWTWPKIIGWIVWLTNKHILFKEIAKIMENYIYDLLTLSEFIVNNKAKFEKIRL